ncbi:MAG: hypothetical protein IJQ79_09120, partial [Bacteroidales bacterium]|nr:hypothetical protein [Bacteroidales bacterium]
MRRTVTALLLLLPLCLSAQYRTPDYADLSESEMVRALKEDVGFLASASLEGRAAGSEGELEAASYMASRLESTGADLLYGADGDVFGLRQDA